MPEEFKLKTNKDEFDTLDDMKAQIKTYAESLKLIKDEIAYYKEHHNEYFVNEAAEARNENQFNLGKLKKLETEIDNYKKECVETLNELYRFSTQKTELVDKYFIVFEFLDMIDKICKGCNDDIRDHETDESDSSTYDRNEYEHANDIKYGLKKAEEAESLLKVIENHRK